MLSRVGGFFSVSGLLRTWTRAQEMFREKLTVGCFPHPSPSPAHLARWEGSQTAGFWCGQRGCGLSFSHRGPPSPPSAALRWPAPTSCHTSLLSRGAVPLPEKSSVLSLLSLLLSQLLETTDRIFIFLLSP